MQPADFKAEFDWFTVVRNPYDRLLSEYYYSVQNAKTQLDPQKAAEAFNCFIQDKIRNRYPNGDHYSEQYLYVEPGVHVLRFESLATDFADIMQLYGLPTHLDLHLNKGSRKIFGAQDFSEATLDLIHTVYRKDF